MTTLIWIFGVLTAIRVYLLVVSPRQVVRMSRWINSHQWSKAINPLAVIVDLALVIALQHSVYWLLAIGLMVATAAAAVVFACWLQKNLVAL